MVLNNKNPFDLTLTFSLWIEPFDFPPIQQVEFNMTIGFVTSVHAQLLM